MKKIFIDYWLLIVSLIVLLILFNVFESETTIEEFTVNLITELIGIAVTLFYVNRVIQRNEKEKQKTVDGKILRDIHNIAYTYMDMMEKSQWNNNLPERISAFEKANSEIFEVSSRTEWEKTFYRHKDFFIPAYCEDNETAYTDSQVRESVDHNIRQLEDKIFDQMGIFVSRVPEKVLEEILEMRANIDRYFWTSRHYGNYPGRYYLENIAVSNLRIDCQIAKSLGWVANHIDIKFPVIE